MLYLNMLRLQPLCGQVLKNCKIKFCILNKNVSLKAVLNRPYSNLVSQTAKTKSTNINAGQEKDKLLYFYENPRHFYMLNGFAFVQFIFWTHMAEFTFTTGEKIKMETNEYTPWWKKINFQDKNTKMIVSTVCFLIGWGVLSMAWIYTLRSVRMLVLRKDNTTVSIVTYGPFGRNRVLDVPMENMSTQVSRTHAKTQLPIKVKGKWFHFILDMREGKFQNPDLFDHTAGMNRILK